MALVFPPFVDPRAPYLALPSLTAYLRYHHVPVTAYDYNLSWFHDSLQPDALHRTLNNVPGSQYVVDNIELAVATLRTPERFGVGDKYSWARNIIDLALMLIGSQYHGWDLTLRRVTSADRSLRDASTIIRSGIPSPFSSHLHRYIEKLVDGNSDIIVGISITNMSQLYPGLYVAHVAKSLGVKVIAGGATVTLLREHLEHWEDFPDYLDGVVYFDGEASLLQIWRNASTNLPLSCGLSHSFFPRDTRSVHYENCLRTTLDDLPTPDFSDFALAEYYSPQPVLPLLASRGCSWGRCTFCSIHITSLPIAGVVEQRSIPKLVDDITALKQRHSTSTFFFVDENFDQHRLVEFSQALIAKKLDASWVAFARFDKTMTERSANTLASGGCRKLLLGLESVSPRTLKRMKKGITIPIVRQNLSALCNAGIAVHLFCIVGFPGETERESSRTLEFIREHIEELRRPGFSCSFSEFVASTGSSISRGDASASPLPASISNDTAIALRRAYNSAINDMALPLVMIGWEEHSLLMIIHGTEPFTRVRATASDISRLLHGRSPLFLVAASWTHIESSNMPIKTTSRLILNTENAVTLACSAGVVTLLENFRTPRHVQDLLGHSRYSNTTGKTTLMGALSLLWKNGFLKRS